MILDSSAKITASQVPSGDDVSALYASYSNVSQDTVAIRHSGGWGIYNYKGTVTRNEVVFENNKSGDYHEQ